MKRVYLYADGGCRGNPGIGGWGTILSYTDSKNLVHTKEIKGCNENTTNNQMELTAIIEGLKLLKEKCYITIVTDSSYVVDSINKHWIDSWIRKGWKKADGKPVKNIELWKELLRLLEGHNVTFTWIKGHNGHEFNERCDKLANLAMDSLEEKL